jgi:hypothetical protein
MCRLGRPVIDDPDELKEWLKLRQFAARPFPEH